LGVIRKILAGIERNEKIAYQINAEADFVSPTVHGRSRPFPCKSNGNWPAGEILPIAFRSSDKTG